VTSTRRLAADCSMVDGHSERVRADKQIMKMALFDTRHCSGGRLFVLKKYRHSVRMDQLRLGVSEYFHEAATALPDASRARYATAESLSANALLPNTGVDAAARDGTRCEEAGGDQAGGEDAAATPAAGACGGARQPDGLIGASSPMSRGPSRESSNASGPILQDNGRRGGPTQSEEMAQQDHQGETRAGKQGSTREAGTPDSTLVGAPASASSTAAAVASLLELSGAVIGQDTDARDSPSSAEPKSVEGPRATRSARKRGKEAATDHPAVPERGTLPDAGDARTSHGDQQAAMHLDDCSSGDEIAISIFLPSDLPIVNPKKKRLKAAVQGGQAGQGGGVGSKDGGSDTVLKALSGAAALRPVSDEVWNANFHALDCWLKRNGHAHPGSRYVPCCLLHFFFFCDKLGGVLACASSSSSRLARSEGFCPLLPRPPASVAARQCHVGARTFCSSHARPSQTRCKCCQCAKVQVAVICSFLLYYAHPPPPTHTHIRIYMRITALVRPQTHAHRQKQTHTYT
jgi:hypothetical protein